MKFLKIGLATILSITFSISVFALDLDGESFNLSGKITSVEIKDGGGVILFPLRQADMAKSF